MQGKKAYQEKLFTSFQLSDHIPAENIYNKILKEVDFQFIYKLTESYYGKEGQSSIDPVVFFKLILFGYLENIPSDRRIIHNARMRMDALFFIGYDIDEELPWHSTLSRTRKLYGEEVFLEVFKKVLKGCMKKGMLSGKRQAVDSYLMKANASLGSMLENEVLMDAALYTKELVENEEVIKIKTEEPKQRKTNKTHYSPSDPEAKIAVKPGKPYALSYLGQISVDTSSHIITHAQAFSADTRDSLCLEEIIDHTQDNLAQEQLSLQEVVADTNYSGTASLESLEKRKIIGYIPNFGGFKLTREGFEYDKENDRYICSRGKFLHNKGSKKNHSESIQYLSSSKDCKTCPIKAKCIGKSNHKMITQTLSRPLFLAMEKRINSSKGKRMRKLRQSTVEPVIGSITSYFGAKKTLAKGLKSASKHLILSAIAYNLKKLVNHSIKTTQSWYSSSKNYLNGIKNLSLLWFLSYNKLSI